MMSDEPEPPEVKEPCSFKKLSEREGFEENEGQVRMEGEEEGLIQDQIIIAPEIMRLILENLDFRSLKQVRMVCKSWLLEANYHIKMRGAFFFNEQITFKRVEEFLEIRKKEIPALPQPFQSVHVDFSRIVAIEPYYNRRSHKYLLKNLFCELRKLCPPLALSSFTTGKLPLYLALECINQSSSTLEYLRLGAEHCDADFFYCSDPEKQFLQLKHLSVYSYSKRGSNASSRARFQSMISGIAKASPNLATYDLSCVENAELGALLWTAVDTIQNVKTLKFRLKVPSYRLSLELFLSIPFRQLAELDIHTELTTKLETLRVSALVVSHCANTLRKLGLFCRTFESNGPEDVFPVCPNVQELSLSSLAYSSNFLSNRFPSLQMLDVESVRVDIKDNWCSLVPFLGVKSLTVRWLNGSKRHLGRNRDIPIVVKFFEKFPNLEHLHTRSVWLMHCCMLKASGDPSYSTLLAGVKHVVLDPFGNDSYTFDIAWKPGSSLAALTGIQIFTMTKFSPSIATMVGNELKDLKIFQFPWETKNFDPVIKVLLEVASRVEKVVIKNGCSFSPFREPRDRRSQELLQEFYESAPNVECECGTRHVLGL